MESFNTFVRMPDGVELGTTVSLPDVKRPVPAVLVRTAYDRSTMTTDHSAGTGPLGIGDLLTRGLAVIFQDVRGRYGSAGDFYPFVNEGEDGVAMLDWVADQPWCNGRIGMFGDSYLAATQLAVSGSHHPALKALNPRFMAGDPWRHAYFCDGAFSLALCFTWLCFNVDTRQNELPRFAALPREEREKLLRHLPLLTIDEAAGRGVVAAYRDFVSHETRDPFWAAMSWMDQLQRAGMPVMVTGGYYDYYAGEASRMFQLLRTSQDQGLAQSHRLVLGPWVHGVNRGTALGDVDFGLNAVQENDATVRWLDAVLNHDDPRSCHEAPVRIFVMGINEWRSELEWPIRRARNTPWYVDSERGANGLAGDGSLSPERPRGSDADHYTYDPDRPVPTVGGNHSIGPGTGLGDMAPWGPRDHRAVEARTDVLVYTSETLVEDVEVTGPVSATLYAVSSGADTDWVVRLCDVHPDGRSINLAEGVMRARFRDRRWSEPRLLEPGQMYQYSVDLQVTSNVFRAGHRIRLQITSSCFPLWDRNLNTGLSVASADDVAVAQQTILHTPKYATHVLLPIVPMGDVIERP